MRRDLGHAIRTLRHSPGFTTAAVLILAIAIGMGSAVFTVFDAVLRRPLPVTDQDRIVSVWPTTDRASGVLPLMFDQFERYREQSSTLVDVAAITDYGSWPWAMRDGERTLPLRESLVTGNLFRVLGVSPVLGRLLRPEDDIFGAEPVMVLSYGLWQSTFGGDPSVIGRRLVHHGRNTALTVVGVAPPGLEFPAHTDFWTPIVPATTPTDGDAPRAYVRPVGRLGAGVLPTATGEELAAFMEREVDAGTSEAGRFMTGVTVQPFAQLVVGDVRPALLVLTAAVALLVLIACTNIGNLLLVRASVRGREIALRRALGASYRDIVRQLLVESAVLGACGGLLGLFLAEAFRRGIVAFAPAELPRLDLIRLGGAPFLATAAITLAAVALFGVAPALWSARGNLAALTRGGARAGNETPAGRRTRQTLVAWQVALAIMVLAAAGLLGRSLAKLERLDLGFAAEQLSIVEISWSWREYDSPEKIAAFYDQLIPRLERIHGIDAVTPLLLGPFSGSGGFDTRLEAEGQPPRADSDNPFVNMEVGGPGYFRTFGLPILRGRGFTDADRANSPKVVVVSDAVARRFWPGEDPIGKRLIWGTQDGEREAWTVVGMVGETRYRDLRSPTPTLYFSYRQLYAQTMIGIRSTTGLGAVLPQVRTAVRETAPGVVVWKAETMNQLLGRPLAQPRLSALLLAVFGVTALLLAAIGIYGVMSFTVRQRRRELGIRAALGATGGALRTLVLRQAFIVVATGVCIGTAGSLAGSRFLRVLLYDTSPNDPLAFGSACLVLFGVALAATYLPARAATRVDPMRVLREE